MNLPIEPRPWQTDFVKAALAHFDKPRHNNLLAAVCPGAGKTIAAYLLDHAVMQRAGIQHTIIVGHTDRIRSQWVETARQLGLRATTDIPRSNRGWPTNAPILVVTYQQVVSRMKSIAGLVTPYTPTLAVFDEIHHAGDENIWGSRIKAAFEDASKRLLLTGTAFRNDGQAIPYVRYDPRTQRVKPDFNLDYATALRHGYVAPIFFHTYDAEGKWARGDDEFEANFGDRLSQEQASYLLNTAITRPSFIRKIVGDAHEQLLALRQAGHDNAAGLIVARDQNHAREISDLVESVTGERPVLVISDDAGANDKLEAFRDAADKWLVAVRMVTEGVDIPRLRVGVFLTNVKSDLFFWQWVGRINRVVAGLDDQSGHAFIPADQDLLEYAREVYQQRLHVLPPKNRRGIERVPRDMLPDEPGPVFEPLAAVATPGAILDPGSGQQFPLALVQWAAKEKAEQGMWGVSEVDYIKIACRFWNVDVEGLVARIGISHE